MLQGMTAHYLVNSTYNVQPGDSVLIHAAAGGVGQLLVQLALARGARVIAHGRIGGQARQGAGPRRPHRAALRRDRRSASSPPRSATANGGAGVTVVYDGVGRATFDASLAALAPRGMLVLFGAASGQVPPFDLQRLNYGGSLFVTRPSLGALPAHPRRAALAGRRRLRRGRRRLAAGRDRRPVPARRRAAAYAALEGRASTGKLLLVP